MELLIKECGLALQTALHRAVLPSSGGLKKQFKLSDAAARFFLPKLIKMYVKISFFMSCSCSEKFARHSYRSSIYLNSGRKRFFRNLTSKSL